MGERDIKVSALILTYNHERFIGEAIEGALMQKTDFPFEVVIAEDCSTDGTRDVVRRYWEKYPDRIRVLLNRHNIGARRTIVHGYKACRGQYVVFTDGDDYWTSPDKFQRQADLLDRRPDCAMCFHSVTMVWENGRREPMVYRPLEVQDTYTLRDLLEYNFIGACAPMYRKGYFAEHPPWFYMLPVGDWTQHVLHAHYGKIGYIDEPMGVYRQHDSGVYSNAPVTRQVLVAVKCLRRFYCALDREYRGAINFSLCNRYCQLAHFYCDEGKPDEARRCLQECFHAVSFHSKIPVRRLLNALLRAFAPSLHRQCKRVGRAIVPARQRQDDASSAGTPVEPEADLCKSASERET